MIFSHVQNPRYKNINVRFICGEEKVFNNRQYVVGDYVEGYWGTEIFHGEYQNKHKEWLDYWVVIREGQIVGVEMKSSVLNKFDIAVKYGLPKIYKVVKNSVIKKKGK